ncbi:hypothetical protein [Clostridium fessum]|jgi:hypothetical protein|uniref:hypothetical protein n=1 Tax=Clostridium fessum TaxID=2126740 RepID=UPI00294236CE|nr:hypothetical protein [Clostridium fessum]
MGLVSKVMKFRLLLKIPRGFLSNGIMRAQTYYNHSSASAAEDSLPAVCRELRIEAHTIEKGLSLPNVRKGFGREKIKKILGLLDQYIAKDQYTYDKDAFLNALGMVCRYVEEAEYYDCDTSFIDLKKYDQWIHEIDLKDYGTARCVRGVLGLPDFGVFTS